MGEGGRGGIGGKGGGGGIGGKGVGGEGGGVEGEGGEEGWGKGCEGRGGGGGSQLQPGTHLRRGDSIIGNVLQVHRLYGCSYMYHPDCTLIFKMQSADVRYLVWGGGGLLFLGKWTMGSSFLC